MFLTGGAMAMVIRAELFQPGLQLVEPDFFLIKWPRYVGLIMVFGAVMPAFTGLANWWSWWWLARRIWRYPVWITSVFDPAFCIFDLDWLFVHLNWGGAELWLDILRTAFYNLR